MILLLKATVVDVGVSVVGRCGLGQGGWQLSAAGVV